MFLNTVFFRGDNANTPRGAFQEFHLQNPDIFKQWSPTVTCKRPENLYGLSAPRSGDTAAAGPSLLSHSQRTTGLTE